MFRRILTLNFLLVALLSIGCSDDDNPVHDDHDDVHAEAIGFVIRSNGVEIARYENGEISGEIEVGVDKETALLSVRFIDEDGDLFTPDTRDGFSLAWEIGDETIAELEQHEEDGAWSFHVSGLIAGSTTMVLKLNHGGHADFVAQAIEVHVTENGPGEEHTPAGD